MYRYLAVFWNGESSASVEHAARVTQRIEAALPGVSCALCEHGAAIYYQTDNPGFFECTRAHQLVILGKAFHTSFADGAVPEKAQFDDSAAHAVCTTRGGRLVQRYWGRYVAFGYDASARSWFAVRDPTAELPCFIAAIGTVTIVFSSMEDCLRLQLKEFSIRWSYLAYSLLFPFRETGQTGFEEVQALEGGEGITIQAGRPIARQCHWDVVKEAVENPITDLNEAVQLARTTLLGCIGALAGEHAQVQLQLSGGLDSSIILAGLLNAPSHPQVQCVHHYDSGIGADERTFARMAVEGACASSGRSCEFIEYERAPQCALEDIMAFPVTARPAHCSGYLLHRRTGLGKDPDQEPVQFTGVGGDGVFLRFKGNAAAIDYAWQRGIDRDFLRVAFETAQSGDSFYGVIRDALLHGLLKQPARINENWGNPCEWVLVDAGTQAAPQPAWMRHAIAQGLRVSPYKMAHISRMVFPVSVLDPFEGAGQWHGVSPISAQPVVELFARIPLHLLMADAEDRTIARRAFEGLLPSAILSRKVKCYLDDHSVAVTRHHRDFIRRLLVGGRLAQRGWIDSQLADAGICRVSPDHSLQALGIFGPQLNIEAWLRRWSASAASGQAVAA
ncbi:asparagine synthase-related protein [Xanthomonas campestris]|uniref:asparagine synthase-related protein n=1 Tax=Xanthomonas campestris TaxID=339 RepID=UPI00096CD7F3|nr:asparagine synthase-related protein [Xanthomonas campestris]MCF8826462.1 asparagine synthetase B family protein [Xanthomonas campestris pv. raphani]MEA9838943.1 asparagine synthase-related protein [Xanthomonas campestris pv. raphani]MEA9878467.1 asparagine synthase-related protein [Xanthomonas campestris pv. raphani]MEA9894890.1 asparagine synthase-related protein [Xanthomonas campestris pv. raphani]MEA9934528.1 asparagine synthase-related protein [Xanthomonas campestris pv. raphani]